MAGNPEALTFATQGGELSYHAEAARQIMLGEPIAIQECKRFGDVVHAARASFPGMGEIAVSTVVGTVKDSVQNLVTNRPSALPPIVGRVDLPVSLSLMGSPNGAPEDLTTNGIHCYVQKDAWLQCEEELRKVAPWIKRQFVTESVAGIEEMLKRDDPHWVAIGPTHCAEALGAVLLKEEQLNPPGSITSFYTLQRDNRERLLPVDHEKTELRVAISLFHPMGDGEFEKALELVNEKGLEVARFIPYGIGDPTKHNPNLRRTGGLLEVKGDLFDEHVRECCARINGLAANDGVIGPFDTIVLGSYDWYPEEPLDPTSVLELEDRILDHATQMQLERARKTREKKGQYQLPLNWSTY